MKKIIVPVDFSEHSEYALETAAIFARKLNLEIIAVHMLEMPAGLLTTTGDFEQIKNVFHLNLAQKKFEEFLEKDYLEGLKVSPIVKHFKVFKEVNDVAKEQDADLIIMGSHGASGFKEIFVGSNTEKVVRFAEIPVLVVKQNPILTDIESVVYACDFSEKSIPTYLKAKELFSGLGLNMHLVHINLPGENFRSTAEMERDAFNFFNNADGNLEALKTVNYVCDYNTESGILNFANVTGADLIAMVTHGRTGLEHFFKGSISEDIANHSALPVMTFKM